MIEKPTRPEIPPKPKSSGFGVVGAGCFGMGLVLGFATLMMAALGGGSVFWMILFGLIAFLSLVLHYIVWGWWLGPWLQAQADREAANDTQEK